MKSFVTKALIALAALLITGAPLAAGAQPWHRGEGWRDHRRHEWREHRWRRHEYYGRPVYYRRPYDGYYGVSPAGYHGYYSHGGWYPHRRWQNGVYVYFRL
jgi:hypothetical protein